MKPHIAEKVPYEAWELFRSICQVIDALPPILETPAYLFGLHLDSLVSHFIPDCHTVARGIAAHFPVDVHDGFVRSMDIEDRLKRHNHSWLTIKGGDPSLIIDPWPLGVVSGPALFFQDYAFHFGPEYSFLYHRTEEFQSGVNTVIEAVGKTIKLLHTPLQRVV